MTGVVNAFNLEETRVPIVIPLAVIGVFAVIQLALGTDPRIMALCVAATAIPFIPMSIYGRDLYSITGMLFSLRYTGVALIAKTFYGQPLQEHLYNPLAAYSWDLLLMITLTAILMLARALDRGTTAFPFPTDMGNLRRLAVICFAIGTVAQVFVAGNKSTADGASFGPVLQLATTVAELSFLALIAEVQYAIAKSNGRSFITPFLASMFGVLFMFTLAFNVRSVLASGLLAIVVTAFMYKMLRLHHIVIGLAAAGFFISFLTPVTLYLRYYRSSMPVSQFAMLAADTIVKAATDPTFFKMISDYAETSAFSNTNAAEEMDYDYFGDRQNVLNRLSYIGLLDAVDNSVSTRLPLGMYAVDQVLIRTAPGFLGYSKVGAEAGMGDWLSWQTGLSEPETKAFLNFGLPMEGLATWGWMGFFGYPILFLLPVLLLLGCVSSLRLPLPLSIYLFAGYQHGLVENASDGFLGDITRSIPVQCVMLFGLYIVFFKHSASAANRSIVDSTANASPKN